MANITDRKGKRPLGLTVLAGFHFLAATGTVVRVALFPGEVAAVSTILAGTIMNVILIACLTLTAIGFLKQDWKLGFIGGNAYAILVLVATPVNAVIFAGLDMADLPRLLPFLVYPVVLLLLLNLRYKTNFLPNHDTRSRSPN